MEATKPPRIVATMKRKANQPGKMHQADARACRLRYSKVFADDINQAAGGFQSFGTGLASDCAV